MTVGTIVYEQQFKHVNISIPIEEWTEKVGWVSSIDRQVSVGVYAYHPPIAQLITGAKRLMRNIAFASGFEEHIFPRHYDFQNLSSFGWVDDGDLASQLMTIKPLTSENSDLRGNDLTLSDPLQCIGFYAMLLEVQRRLGGYLPGELFDEGAFCVYEDQGGWTLRNETKQRLLQGWGTCFEFSGAEFVFAGSADQVYNTRWDLLCSIAELLSELRLTYRVVVARPCSHAKSMNVDMPNEYCAFEGTTLDIEVYIPQYVDSRDPWLELGGGDVAGDTITSAFGLRLASGEPLFSGCQGVGWQRFALAVFSQLGTDPASWPEPLRSEYGVRTPHSRISKLFRSY